MKKIELYKTTKKSTRYVTKTIFTLDESPTIRLDEVVKNIAGIIYKDLQITYKNYETGFIVMRRNPLTSNRITLLYEELVLKQTSQGKLECLLTDSIVNQQCNNPKGVTKLSIEFFAVNGFF